MMSYFKQKNERGGQGLKLGCGVDQNDKNLIIPI